MWYSSVATHGMYVASREADSMINTTNFTKGDIVLLLYPKNKPPP